jgi:hypothetical protein
MSEDEWDDSYLESIIARCPKCDTLTNDPVKAFDLNGLAVAPESEFVLWEIVCHTCELPFDVAVWTPPGIVEEAVKGEYGDFNHSLLERYHNKINEIAAFKGSEEVGGEGLICECKGDSSDTDLEFLDLEKHPDFTNRAPIVPMEALALARGMRMAMVQCPERMFRCTIGPFNFVLSLEQVGEASPSYAMHFSISNRIAGDLLTDRQINFALALFFSAREYINLSEEPSLNLAGKEVKHYFIPSLTQRQ